MKPLIIIPTLNEVENIPDVITRIMMQYNSQCHVLVVDGNSTDGTVQAVEELRKTYSSISIITQSENNLGFGRALSLGFEEALKNDFDPIITMDGDGSHDPVYIETFLSLSKQYDMIIGSRYLNGVRVEGWKFRKLLLSKLANMYVSYVLVKPIWDFTSGFRCYSKQLLETVNFEELHSQAYTAQIQLVHSAFQHRFVVKEIPFIYKDTKSNISRVDQYSKLRTFFFVLKYRAPLLEIYRHLTYIKKDYTRFVEEYEELVNPPKLKNDGKFDLKDNYEISIGVMAHNEEKLIKVCLDKLLHQDLNGHEIKEITVVSSGSTDNTNTIVNEFSKKDKRIKLIIQSKRLGKASAINEFLKVAEGDIAIIESADTFTEPNTIIELIKPFNHKKTGMVGAHPVPVNEKKSFIGYCVHKLWAIHHEMAMDNPKCGEMIAFRNLIIKIPHYTAVDEAAIESIIKYHGFKLEYAKDAIVHNKGPENVRDFFKQRRRIASGHRHLWRSTGHEVTTHSSKNILKYILKDQSWNPKYILFTIILILIEAISRFVGVIDYYMRDKNPFIWDISKSTKHIS